MTSLSSSKAVARQKMPRRAELPPVKEFISTATKSGTGAHVTVPKAWIGKKVKVIVLEDEKE